MSDASCLLSLQEIDLELSRVREKLSNPAELQTYKSALTTQKRIESLMTALRGQHKDLDMDLSDLDEEQKRLRRAIEEVRARGESNASNYRNLADVREQYSSLAKRLEKSEFRSERTMEALVELEAKEAKVARAHEQAEAEVRRTAQLVRQSLVESQQRAHELEAERRRLAQGLSASVLEAYQEASERFSGLGVERLNGRSPSICRVSLQPGALKDVHRAGPVTRCPYCRRILVVDEGGD